MLYVANYNENEIVVIDTRTDIVVDTIPVSPHPITVKVDPEIDTLLVASLAGNELTFISTTTNNIIKTISTGNTGPWGLGIDTARHLAYVINRGSNYITVVDTENQEIVTRIPIGAPAQAIAVDETEQMVYTSYMEQDKILKIDGNTNTILTTIDMMGIIPQDMVVDSAKTNKVFVSTKFADKILVIGPESLSIDLPVRTTVYGPDISDPITGAYHVEGNFIRGGADYRIMVELTAIGTEVPKSRIFDNFNLTMVS